MRKLLLIALACAGELPAAQAAAPGRQAAIGRLIA